MKNIEKRKRAILILSFILLVLSIILHTSNALKSDNYTVNYEYVNIKDMAQARVANKKETKANSLVSLSLISTSYGSLTEMSLVEEEPVEEVDTPTVTQLDATVPRRIWYLPTEVGTITQYAHYGHAALDITSPRREAENIFPVANGVISSIYTDSAGALVVSVLHDIDGQKYTSLYAHLSRYADGLYVGKPVTINDSLGLMGTTGYSTGVHLHLVVIDCSLFDSNDNRCNNLNNFFRYSNQRINEGFYGLGNMMDVPASWSSR